MPASGHFRCRAGSSDVGQAVQHVIVPVRRGRRGAEDADRDLWIVQNVVDGQGEGDVAWIAVLAGRPEVEVTIRACLNFAATVEVPLASHFWASTMTRPTFASSRPCTYLQCSRRLVGRARLLDVFTVRMVGVRSSAR